MEAVRHIRTMRGMNQVDLARASGVAQNTISEIELGKRDARPGTLKKLADALNVDIADFFEDADPLAQAPSSQQLTLNGALEEERRTIWETAVENARQLRDTGRIRMAKLLLAYRSSRERREAYDTRRGYLDAMGALLQQAYDAEVALIKAADTDMLGSRFLEQWPELQKADRFYIELWHLVQGADLRIRTDGEQASEQLHATDDLPQTRPLTVEEREAA